MRRSVAELGAFSASTTKRLDEIYYSMLERLSLMQSSVLAIRELAMASKQMDTSFQKSSGEAVSNVNKQLIDFGDFAHHQSRIEELQSRITKGQNKIRGLSQRVDAVGDRIDGWERADREWQESTRRRLKVIWFLIFVFIATFCLLFLLVLPAVDQGRVQASLQNHTTNIGAGEGEDMAMPSNQIKINFKSTSSDDDERLRLFDEL